MSTSGTSLFQQLVAAAMLAPSSHNTQPWRFRGIPDGVELYADRSRALPINDPNDRELTISCGAALCNLRLAAAQARWSTLVELLPDPSNRDLLARLTLTGRSEPSADDAMLYSALPRRHTWRESFLDRRVDEGEARRLAAAAAHRGTELRWVTSPSRKRLAALVEQADRQQFSDRRWRRELAFWMRSPRQGDGLPVAGALPLTRWAVSLLDVGHRIGRRDAVLLQQAPLVAVLSTRSDEPRDWLVAGQALQRVLLTAAAAEILIGFANQPCQVGWLLRQQVAAALGWSGYPQLLLRAGYPSSSPVPTPRRPISDVLLPTPTRAMTDHWLAAKRL